MVRPTDQQPTDRPFRQLWGWFLKENAPAYAVPRKTTHETGDKRNVNLLKKAREGLLFKLNVAIFY